MTKKTKQYLYSVLLIVAFISLSVINLHLIVKKGNNDMILLYSIACFFFVYWLFNLIFPIKFFRFNYKIFQKPMSKSMTMDLMGTHIASEKKAYETFKKVVEISPYIYLTILIIEIILLTLF